MTEVMTRSVPLLDLGEQHATLGAEMRRAIERVMSSQAFILGPEVRALEEEIAAYAKTSYAVGCASGSDALLLALMALEVGPGDEVITTPYSFFATASAIVRLGARPVFVDINARTYNLEAKSIEAAITARTRAVMPVHLYGQCAEMDDVREICARRGNLPIVEDAAQAIGAEERGRRAGSLGAIGCFSFYPSKNLGGAGDGGMLTTDNQALAERLRTLRVHGSERKYYYRFLGLNSRLDSIQAAILRVKLPHLDAWSDARRRNAERYEKLFAELKLTDRVELPWRRAEVRHIYNQFVIRVAAADRDALIEHLKRRGVGTEIYYPLPLHMQECFADLNYREGDFPEAERAARETIALPIYPELEESQQRTVVEAIAKFY